MASITISDLRPAGADLFQDSESFLHELTEQEVGNLLGGGYVKFRFINGGFVLSWG